MHDATTLAAAAAIDNIFGLRISHAAFERSLSSPGGTLDSGVSAQIENKIVAALRDRLWSPETTLLFRNAAVKVPKLLVQRHPEIRALLDPAERELNDLRTHLWRDALDWAKATMDEAPEIVSEFCCGERGCAALSHAIVAIMGGDSPRSPAKAYRVLDRTLASLKAAIDRFGCHADRDECDRLAIDAMFGSARPLAIHALAGTYGWVVQVFALTMRGVPLGDVEDLGDVLGEIPPELLHSIFEHTERLDGYSFPAASLIAYGDEETMPLLSDITEASRDSIELLIGLLEESDRQQIAATKDWQRTERELRGEVARLQAQLRAAPAAATGAGEDPSVAPLRAENAALRSEIALLRTELRTKDTRPSPVVPAATPSPGVSPVPRLSPDDALALLSARKGVLVGGHRLMHRKLTQLLPTWSFYTPDDVHLSETVIRNADLVVFFTKHLSHKVGDKVLAAVRQKGIPVVYAYKVNPDAFLREVAEKLPTSAMH